MKEGISLNSIVMVAKEQVSADLSDEAAILNLKSSIYYGLDAVGARIWSLIQEPRAVSEIRDTILQEYDVEPKRCQEDLFAVIEEGRLVESGTWDSLISLAGGRFRTLCQAQGIETS